MTAMLEFVKQHYLLIAWMAFVILVYLYVYLDYLYYKNNVREKLYKMYEALTEED